MLHRVSTRAAIFLIASYLLSTWAIAKNDCEHPVYLTLDTGHMEVAPLMAEVLKRQDVMVTFFAANERTKTGDGTLGHVYWRADLPGEPTRFRMRPSAGPMDGKESTWEAAQYCAELDRANQRLLAITGKKPLPLFRAPGGKTSPKLLSVAKTCGYAHVGWSAAGFLGDELPSETFGNDALLAKALRNIRSGDILMAHLGIWSRKDAWAPAVLEPLIVGLKAKGFCFQTLREHPAYKNWIVAHGR
jgi:peptidoglycan/xylan/chitin deacetylase (PgdA/CDA1 family)